MRHNSASVLYAESSNCRHSIANRWENKLIVPLTGDAKQRHGEESEWNRRQGTDVSWKVPTTGDDSARRTEPADGSNCFGEGDAQKRLSVGGNAWCLQLTRFALEDRTQSIQEILTANSRQGGGFKGRDPNAEEMRRHSCWWEKTNWEWGEDPSARCSLGLPATPRAAIFGGYLSVASAEVIG